MLKTNEFKDRLQEEKSRLERMITSAREGSQNDGGTSGGINDSFPNSGDDEYADAATNVLNRELDMTMVNKYRDHLDAVNAALGRIAAGSYGTCVRCQQAIGEGRLDAIPETPFCRACESDVEVQG